MAASQAVQHATPSLSYDADKQKTAVIFLGEMSAGTYAGLPPRMQAACREMVKLGEMTIEGMPGQLAASGGENGIRASSH